MNTSLRARLAVLGSTAALLAAGAPLAHAAVAEQPNNTVQVVVRPVDTDNHHLAPGFHVHNAGGSLDCSPAETSVVAVSDDIFSCSPDAADAVACFQANTPHYVLCDSHPRDNPYLERFRVDGAIPQVEKPGHAEPLLLALTDGVDCLLRDGGALNHLKGRPNYYVTYTCTQGRAVWAYGSNSGVHEVDPEWTVRTAPIDGQEPLYTHQVARVYYVGSASS